jgi:epoxyqueuosine reductase QueG
MSPFSKDPAGAIEALIQTFVAESPQNDLGRAAAEKAFDAPLVGYSNGGDSLYAEYVAHIGDFYRTPLDFFLQAFPDQAHVPADDLTVISWILPSTAAVRTEQAAETQRPSERWIRVRYFGEKFNDALRGHVVATLAAAGISAVAPMGSPFWRRMDLGPYAPCSNWSERHAAYAAGLGTFGLCDGFITPVGKAVRIGSVITRLSIAPTARPYADHHANCLQYSHGTCGQCIARCPVNALSASGHDKKRCMQYVDAAMRDYSIKTYGIDITACGLCQAGVPCTDHIPQPREG